MSEAEVGLDRLPWLADEPKAPKARSAGRGLRDWALASIVLVAGASFWLGSRNPAGETALPPAARAPSTRVTLPEPRPAAEPEVRIARPQSVKAIPSTEVRPAPVRELRIVPAAPRKIAAADVARLVSSDMPAVPPTARTAPAAKLALPDVLIPWPSRVTAGAHGRLVQIGAYGSRLQAKRGWSAMVRAYPAVAHLSAVVVETRNSKARPFYRFQIGTTSQAHSEVLCQRMRKIDLSCAVVGLPWKAKVER